MSDAELGFDVGAILLSCEHAGHDVPPEFGDLFRGAEETLRSHRGWDPGAHEVALRLSRTHRRPLFAHFTTRLLVDANRSIESEGAYSEFSRGLDAEARARIAARHHRPHRDAVQAFVAAHGEQGVPLLHLAIHSFVDVLDGETRDLDLGLLFDPDRPGEAALCRRWRRELEAEAPELRVRLNEPYLGEDDGLPTALRAKTSPKLYAGIEIEIRQGLVADARGRDRISEALAVLFR